MAYGLRLTASVESHFPCGFIDLFGCRVRPYLDRANEITRGQRTKAEEERKNRGGNDQEERKNRKERKKIHTETESSAIFSHTNAATGSGHYKYDMF